MIVSLLSVSGSAVVRFAGFAHPNVDHATSGAQLFTGRYAAVMAYTCSDKGESAGPRPTRVQIKVSLPGHGLHVFR